MRTPFGSGPLCVTIRRMQIKPGDLDDPRVIKLLTAHVTRARAETAPGSAHAIDLTGLRSPDISLWTLWAGDRVISVGALKHLSADHREVKSMFTAESARRTGAAGRVLQHLIATAREQGVRRLSLETGAWPYFAPARAFYARHGFTECGPFADYLPDPNSVFMTRTL